MNVEIPQQTNMKGLSTNKAKFSTLQPKHEGGLPLRYSVYTVSIPRRQILGEADHSECLRGPDLRVWWG